MVSDNNTQTKRSRNMILLLAAVFLLPMLIAWVLIYSVDDWGVKDTRNKGDLVRPAKPLQPFTLMRHEGESFGLDDIKKKWSIVYIGNGSCGETCESVIYKTRQVRLAQGKEMDRVRRLFILNGMTLTPDQESYYAQAHPDLILLDGDPNQLDGFIRQFSLDDKEVGDAGRVYIVDPLGNLMMRYEPGFDAEWLLKDVRRLLHVSQIG